MLQDLLSDCAAWWSTVPPEFAFLLALPFGLAAVTLSVDAWRARREHRVHRAPRPSARHG